MNPSHDPPTAAGVELSWQRLDVMSGPAVHELIRLREAVFVVEQVCAYQEADEHDLVADHLLAREDKRLTGCLRLLPPTAGRRAPSIGRVLVVDDRRGHGLATRLMQEALAETDRRWPDRPVYISAQQYLVGFYEALGFTTRGDGYLEDGIPHIAMVRAAGQNPSSS